jgi:hypothetical protein
VKDAGDNGLKPGDFIVQAVVSNSSAHMKFGIVHSITENDKARIVSAEHGFHRDRETGEWSKGAQWHWSDRLSIKHRSESILRITQECVPTGALVALARAWEHFKSRDSADE